MTVKLTHHAITLSTLLFGLLALIACTKDTGRSSSESEQSTAPSNTGVASATVVRRLEGEPSSLALDAIYNYHDELPDTVSLSVPAGGFVSSSIIHIGLANEATVGDFNKLLDSIDGSIYTMARNVDVVWLRIPTAADFVTLQAVVDRVGADPSTEVVLMEDVRPPRSRRANDKESVDDSPDRMCAHIVKISPSETRRQGAAGLVGACKSVVESVQAMTTKREFKAYARCVQETSQAAGVERCLKRVRESIKHRQRSDVARDLLQSSEIAKPMRAAEHSIDDAQFAMDKALSDIETAQTEAEKAEAIAARLVAKKRLEDGKIKLKALREEVAAAAAVP